MQKWMLIQNERIETGDATLLDRWRARSGSLLWVDIEGPADDDDHALLVESLALPEAEVRDALRDRHPPTFVGEQGLLFLLLKPLDSESHSLDFGTQQLAIFCGDGFVVTRHSKTSEYLESLWSQVDRQALAGVHAPQCSLRRCGASMPSSSCQVPRCEHAVVVDGRAGSNPCGYTQPCDQEQRKCCNA